MLGFLPLIVAKYDRWLEKKKKKRTWPGSGTKLCTSRIHIIQNKKKVFFHVEEKRDYRQNTVKWINIYSTNEKISI